ncbi:hypothetical protein QEG98_04860 [Myxococcus sp. MxC21-1]|uniref:hypothetical protein n=1 Tax=Myxococcus sp. MxC21-1 TaxID=3041439 RepID=UPI00292E0FB9|nr:hypothetical protein [Myxococcus sp. MxC21-1]WNZ63120.1 hypothetical protein QEG98_04860 [Myxococcus sp. MxC21-1]
MHPPLENGARRGAQVRCPACTRFHEPGLLCPRCDCGPVPPERYGAARMLVHAGVDRYALADRVSLLPTSMVERLESRYARMWAYVRRLLVGVRRYEQALFLQGFEEAVEDRWAQRLPWHVPEEEPAVELEEGVHTAVPALEPRWLAALVDVHEGTPSHEALDMVLTCLEDDGRFGCEAALALTRWRVWPRAHGARVATERIARLARAAFARFPEQGTRAAVAWMRATGQAPDADLLLALREGLNHPDADLRFECALCLQDEDSLLAAVESTDLARAEEARRALASRGSVRLLERMASRGDADFALDVLRRLPAQAPPGALSALLAVSDRVEGDWRRRCMAGPMAGLSRGCRRRNGRCGWIGRSRGWRGSPRRMRFVSSSGPPPRGTRTAWRRRAPSSPRCPSPLRESHHRFAPAASRTRPSSGSSRSLARRMHSGCTRGVVRRRARSRCWRRCCHCPHGCGGAIRSLPARARVC